MAIASEIMNLDDNFLNIDPAGIATFDSSFGNLAEYASSVSLAATDEDDDLEDEDLDEEEEDEEYDDEESEEDEDDEEEDEEEDEDEDDEEE